jgi:hypothetical protein
MAVKQINKRIGSYPDLEYGADRNNKSDHYVKFNARVFVDGDVSLSGGSHHSEPTNQKQNLTVARVPRTESKGSIKLYLPAQISVSQKSNYGEAEMGGAIAATTAAVNNFSGGVGATAKAVVGEFGTSFGDVASRVGAGFMDTIGVTGASSKKQIQDGVIKNNRTEMMFEGIDRRAFSFTFRLIPHNATEAAVIQKIVTSFRYHMLPEVPAGADFGRILKVPSTYMINYAHERELHRIGECVLESVDVKYGGERPQFYHDNRPTETELTLQFKELEIMTKDKIKAGF